MHILDGAIDAVNFANRVSGRVCIVTNCPRPITSQILGCTKSLALINALTTNGQKPLQLVCADDEVEFNTVNIDEEGNLVNKTCIHKIAPKPKTDMVFEAARILGVDPSECLLVGDSKYDIQCIADADGVGVGIGADHGAFKVDSVTEITSFEKVFDFQK